MAKKAHGINDEVECLKHSFAVIHLWQKCELLFQVSGVNQNAGSLCILCDQNVCAGEFLLASAQFLNHATQDGQ